LPWSTCPRTDTIGLLMLFCSAIREEYALVF
jgi:hypothetical protein